MGQVVKPWSLRFDLTWWKWFWTSQKPPSKHFVNHLTFQMNLTVLWQRSAIFFVIGGRLLPTNDYPSVLSQNIVLLCVCASESFRKVRASSEFHLESGIVQWRTNEAQTSGKLLNCKDTIVIRGVMSVALSLCSKNVNGTISAAHILRSFYRFLSLS